jgi:hypothetical protein
MIRKILKIFYAIGVIFWGGMFLSAVINLIAYNEPFKIFDFDTVQIANYVIVNDTVVDRGILNIAYTYKVGDDIYSKKLDVAESYFKSHFRKSSDTTIEVSYNVSYPQVSYITTMPLEQRKEKIGIYISLFFLSFISALYFYKVKRI